MPGELLILKDDKLNFGIKICAMIFTLSHTNYLITHTGNGGFFLSMLFYLKKKTFVQLR